MFEAGPGFVGSLHVPVWKFQLMVAQLLLTLHDSAAVPAGNTGLEQVQVQAAAFGAHRAKNRFWHIGSSLMVENPSLTSLSAVSAVTIYRFFDPNVVLTRTTHSTQRPSC
ncbi:hypothetical protein D3C78_1449990 [compost metagenome]